MLSSFCPEKPILSSIDRHEQHFIFENENCRLRQYVFVLANLEVQDGPEKYAEQRHILEHGKISKGRSGMEIPLPLPR